MDQVDPGERLNRRQVVSRLLENRGDLAVVSGLGSPTYDVASCGDHDNNFYLWGAMGSAAMLGYGIATAQPARPVTVFTGDGEMLMGLGSLATVGLRPCSNLTLVVIDNGQFGETGRQISHTGYGLSLAEIAGTCGFDWCREITDMSAVDSLHQRMHANQGMTFATVKVYAEELERVLPPRDGALISTRFRSAMGL
jgi:thiamine pyrophosphate-dependent acetolactate synthase large subunit-like protein